MLTTVSAALAELKARMASRDRAGVNAAASSLINLNAPLGAQWPAIAKLLQYNGEHRLAVLAMQRWTASSQNDPVAHYQLATTLARGGRASEALQRLSTVPSNIPDALTHAYLKGTLALDSGDRDLAVATLSSAIETYPNSGQTWLARVMAGGIAEEERVAIRAARGLFDPRQDQDAASFFVALGKVEGEAGAYDEALASFERAASIMRTTQSFDTAADRARVDQEFAGWTEASLVSSRGDVDDDGSSPIFVTGLPRSGTTLVEQILASHSAVAGGAELGVFPIIGRDLGGLSHAALKNWRAAGGDIRELRNLYHHLARQRFPEPGRVVDKTLSTSRYLGVIASVFPSSPIIWLRRNPRDCAWSIFSNMFVSGVEWGWSFEDIAAFFNQEDRLFAHWTALLPNQILVVPYEDLVSNPEQWIHRINAHAGLTGEPSQRNPHLLRRSVNTNSGTQVRQPINRKGIGSSTPYRDALDRFEAAYADSQV